MLPISASRWSSFDGVLIAFDGSARNGKAGWGVTIACPGAATTIDLYGPVVCNGGHRWIGADSATNNCANLSGLYIALRWIAAHTAEPIVLQYDSTYAIGVARGHMRPKRNIQLVNTVKRALCLVSNTLQYVKIAAHTGALFNEHADRLAKLGASGQTSGVLDAWFQMPSRCG